MLYEAFPSARYYLIDPTQDSRPYMEAIARNFDAYILNIALGNQEASLPIEVRSDINGCTVLQEIGPSHKTGSYDVEVCRFDVAVNDFDQPALCKIDVQGAELMVLEGMGEKLSDIDVYIKDVSTIAAPKNTPGLMK